MRHISQFSWNPLKYASIIFLQLSGLLYPYLVMSHDLFSESNHAYSLASPGGASGKEPTFQCTRPKKHSFNPWVRKTPWRRAWQPTPVFLPGESHGQRSLMGHNPQGHKEFDMTEVTEHAQRKKKGEKTDLYLMLLQLFFLKISPLLGLQ